MLSGKASILPFSPQAADDLNRRRLRAVRMVLQAGPRFASVAAGLVVSCAAGDWNSEARV